MKFQKPPNKYSRYHQGIFENATKFKGEGEPIFRSSLELKFMSMLEGNPEIVEWSSENIAIPYFHDGRMRKYWVDFVIAKTDGKRYIVEVKPHAQTMKGGKDFPKNAAKWNAAIKWAPLNGFHGFIIITERSLGATKKPKR